MDNRFTGGTQNTTAWREAQKALEEQNKINKDDYSLFLVKMSSPFSL